MAQTGTKRIRIFNLPPRVTKDHVLELAEKYGKVTSVEVLRDNNQNGNRGSEALVTFLTVNDAEFAIYRLRDKVFQTYVLEAALSPVTQKEIDDRKKDKLAQRDVKSQKSTDTTVKKKKLLKKDLFVSWLL
jgi:RNA recognition motif-containing protein